MDERLVSRLMALTPEEERLLSGAPLEREDYTSGMSSVFSSRKLLPASRMIALRKHTRFAEFPAHSHDYIEILYMLSGETTHEMPGEAPLTLRAGELLMINCRAVHSIHRCGETDIGVNFIIRPSFFDDALAMVGASNALGCFLLDALGRGERSMPYLHFRVADVPSIQRLMESVLYRLLEQEDMHQRTLKAAMNLLLLDLLDHTAFLSVPDRRGSALVLSVLEEIEQHYASIRFDELAQRHHVSPAYLCKMVHKSMGESCIKILQRKRIAQARWLLRDTDLSIAGIAQAVGYENTGHFYRLFERETGLSPRAYRQAQKGSAR